jgi:V8-like Glu-specific endopeptidase
MITPILKRSGKGFPMKILISLSVMASFALCSYGFAQNKGMDVIYGDDNRKDVFESRDSALVELSRSTAAMIAPANLTLSGVEVTVNSKTLQSRGICAKERFSQQASAANCSGFLVAPNIIVTAGHCIKNQESCDNFKWVFDYRVDHSDQKSVRVHSSSVYSCKKIISRALDSASKLDFAVIELNKKVLDRRPLAFRRSGKIAKGTSVAVIGHPTGLPAKITDGATVRSLNTNFFVTNLDTFAGNSGSAVFNTKTSEVEGILVRGENDYVFDSALGCQVSNRCLKDSCRGEDVTFITLVDALKNIR